MNSASPEARDERPGLLALQIDRPRGQHGGALVRRVRARSRVGASCAQLQTHALDLRRAAMPQQPPLFELRAALSRRAPPAGWA